MRGSSTLLDLLWHKPNLGVGSLDEKWNIRPTINSMRSVNIKITLKTLSKGTLWGRPCSYGIVMKLITLKTNIVMP